MTTIYWTTEYPHADNNETICDYLDNINRLDIIYVDGTYAEGVNAQGDMFAIHAIGDGDHFNHKAEFELIAEGVFKEAPLEEEDSDNNTRKI